jgi:hypothetical protein
VLLVEQRELLLVACLVCHLVCQVSVQRGVLPSLGQLAVPAVGEACCVFRLAYLLYMVA